jgi:hypothetical protein
MSTGTRVPLTPPEYEATLWIEPGKEIGGQLALPEPIAGIAPIQP